MTIEARVTTRDFGLRRKKTRKFWRRPWFFLGVCVIAIMAAVLGWKLASIEPEPTEPPESVKVMEAQRLTGNFGILIPAYLPKGFDRAGMEIKVNPAGPTGDPAVDMIYRTRKGEALFLRQWVPANPELEILANSRPIETKWGKGLLLTQGQALLALWVDIGPLRVSLSTSDVDIVSREKLLLTANTLGLANDILVQDFITELPVIQGVEPPPPFEVALNADGVQELNLTITPGGYSPMRFAVQSGIPVKINYRAIGEVGCGDTLIFPISADETVAKQITDETPLHIIEFTPQAPGEYGFKCSANHFRGIMTVRETNPEGQ